MPIGPAVLGPSELTFGLSQRLGPFPRAKSLLDTRELMIIQLHVASRICPPRPGVKRKTKSTAVALFLVGGLAVAFGQKAQKFPVVPLNVTVETQDSSGNPTKIAGDSQGNTYASGSQGVCANFDQYGNLIIDFDCARTSTPRNLVFTFDTALNPVVISTPLGSAPPPVSNGIGLPSYTSYLSTVPPTDYPQGPYIPIQTMVPVSSQCIQVNLNFTYTDKVGTAFRLAYHRNSNNPPYSEIPTTPYGVITRTSPTTWTLEPVAAAACNQPPTITSFLGTAAAPDILTTPTKGSFAFQDAGTWVVPFKFTLTSQ